MLNIGIDARMLMCGGAGRNVYTLIHELLEIDRFNRYTIFVSPDIINKNLLDDTSWPNAEMVNMRVNSLTLKQHIAFLIYYPRKTLDLYHYPHFDMPLIHFNKSVVTIYDLYPLILRRYCSRPRQIYFKELTRLAIHKSSKVIADSQCTKEDIIKHFRIDPRKITVIYPGVEKIYMPLGKDEIKKEVLTKHGIKNKFILYVGNAKPHKNLPRLIRAFGDLPLKMRNEYQLALVGNIAKSLSVDKHIVSLGYIPKDDLLQLYNLTEVLVLVSLYEGFGFPLAEAMACGAPILTSNVASMPEVVGNAGMLVNPYESDDISQAIKTILSDSLLRQGMRRKSLERAALFSSRRAAEKTLQVYEEAVAF